MRISHCWYRNVSSSAGLNTQREREIDTKEVGIDVVGCRNSQTEKRAFVTYQSKVSQRNKDQVEFEMSQPRGKG